MEIVSLKVGFGSNDEGLFAGEDVGLVLSTVRDYIGEIHEGLKLGGGPAAGERCRMRNGEWRRRPCRWGWSSVLESPSGGFKTLPRKLPDVYPRVGGRMRTAPPLASFHTISHQQKEVRENDVYICIC